VTGKSQSKGDKDKDDSDRNLNICSLQGFIVLVFSWIRQSEMLMNRQQATCLEKPLLLNTSLSRKLSAESFIYVLKCVSCHITVDVTAYHESVKNSASLYQISQQ